MSEKKKQTPSLAELKERLGLKHQEFVAPTLPTHQPEAKQDAIKPQPPVVSFEHETSEQIDSSMDFIIDDEPEQKVPSSISTSIGKYAPHGLLCVLGLVFGYSCNSIIKSREAEDLGIQASSQSKTAAQQIQKQLTDLEKLITGCGKTDKASITNCLSNKQKTLEIKMPTVQLSDDQMAKNLSAIRALWTLKLLLDTHWEASQNDLLLFDAKPKVVLQEPGPNQRLEFGLLHGVASCRTPAPCKEEEKWLPVIIEGKSVLVPPHAVFELKSTLLKEVLQTPSDRYKYRMQRIKQSLDEAKTALKTLLQVL